MKTQKTQKVEDWTQKNMMQLVETIVDGLEGKKLEKIASKVYQASSQLGARLGLSQEEAMWLAVLVNLSFTHPTNARQISQFFNCNIIRIMSHWDVVTSLVQRRFIRDLGDNEIGVPCTLLKALKHNQPFVPKSWTDISIDQWVDRLSELIKRCAREENNFETFVQELNYLKTNNTHLPVVQRLREWALSETEEIALLITLEHFVINGDEEITVCDLLQVFDESWKARKLTSDIKHDKSSLIQKSLIEHACSNGQANPQVWHLSMNTKRQMLEGMDIELEATVRSSLTKASDIVSKPLYFNDQVTQQVEQLRDILMPNRFTQVQQRLNAHHMRSGFPCIFYGSPGTGKTETVYQLARQTGRDIMLVDIPSLRSKWVGDTEKNIKAVFDQYRHAVHEMEIAPILLFNEADAILSRRNEGTTNSVDKMENTMQNIILQEMETLDGIMIATTNLTENLDAAFERRFLYKIEFPKPTAAERQHIWKAMLPDLTEEETLELAKQFDFSGGQIENIARKQIIHYVIYDQAPLSLSTIREACCVERIRNTKTQPIGFE